MKMEEVVENDIVTKEYLQATLYEYATKREHLALEASLQSYTQLTQFVQYQE